MAFFATIVRTIGTLMFLSVWPPSARVQAIEITANLMEKTFHSVLLATAAMDEDPTYAETHGFQIYGAYPRMDDGGTAIDYALVAKKDDVCYGVWRGTIPDLDDWLQNFNFSGRTVEGCTVHGGFDQNYSERTVVDAALSACLASCREEEGDENSDCPLVLTGQSQGGATAVVASLYWKDRNPAVITFGAPRAVHSNCGSLQADNHYRFVNVQVSSGMMRYDTVPLLPTGGGRHYGHTFLLSEDDIAYIGSNDNSSPTQVPSTSMHAMLTYLDRIVNLHATAIYPMYNNGWDNDEACGFDYECVSGRCDGTGVGMAIPPYTCRALQGSCGRCNEDDDCESGKCVYIASMFRSYCAGDSAGNMDDGCRCDRGANCLSRRCEGTFPPFLCEAKLSNGQGCNENSDCQSGRCDGWVWDLECK